MARSKKKKKHKRTGNKKQSKNQPAQEIPQEEKSLEAATVGWSISVLILMMADLTLIVGYYFFDFVKKDELVAFTYGLVLYSAVVISLVSFILTLIVFKLRRVTPPKSLGIFASIVQLVPWLMILIRQIN